jgi:hypothetical protein
MALERHSMNCGTALAGQRLGFAVKPKLKFATGCSLKLAQHTVDPAPSCIDVGGAGSRRQTQATCRSVIATGRLPSEAISILQTFV